MDVVVRSSPALFLSYLRCPRSLAAFAQIHAFPRPAAAVPLDLPGKAAPSSSRLRVASELASLQHRSAAHLPPTSATPHIPPPAVKLARDKVDIKGKAKAAYAAGQQGVLDHQRQAASGGHAAASPTTSLNSANSKSKPPVKAKASSKQKRREREKQQKAADFKEKLAVKDSGFEDRKVCRSLAHLTWTS